MSNDYHPEIDAHLYERERAAHLTRRYGDASTAWDKDFGQLDTTEAKARKSSQELQDIIAANQLDPEKPLKFSVRAAGRDVTIQVRPPQEENGDWACNAPVEADPGVWEWRTLLAKTYDGLIATLTRVLSAGPQIRELSESERLALARACTQKKNLPIVLEEYIRLRTGKPPDEYILGDPRYRGVLDAACLFCFFNSDPSSQDSKSFRDYLTKYAGNRPLSVPLVKEAYSRFQKESAMSAFKQRVEAPPVNQAALEKASDQTITESFSAIRRAYAEDDRRKRDLLHRERMSPEQAIEALRGPEE